MESKAESTGPSERGANKDDAPTFDYYADGYWIKSFDGAKQFRCDNRAEAVAATRVINNLQGRVKDEPSESRAVDTDYRSDGHNVYRGCMRLFEAYGRTSAIAAAMELNRLSDLIAIAQGRAKVEPRWVCPLCTKPLPYAECPCGSYGPSECDALRVRIDNQRDVILKLREQLDNKLDAQHEEAELIEKQRARARTRSQIREAVELAWADYSKEYGDTPLDYGHLVAALVAPAIMAAHDE